MPANFRLGMDGFFYISAGDKGFYGCVGADGKRLDMRGGGIVRMRPDGTGAGSEWASPSPQKRSDTAASCVCLRSTAVKK